MFQRLLSQEFLQQALKQAPGRSNNCVFNPLVVLWLLVSQRLCGGAPLQAAVLQLLGSLPASFWPRPCKRVRDWREQGKPLSSHTAAYNEARQALPLSVVEQSCDHIFEQLVAQSRDSGAAPDGHAFLLDGSSVRTAYSAELAQLYPPGSNQYGQAHWPVLRLVVAHDLHTGLAMRPEWGPMYGPDAVSEQALFQRAIGRLPQGAAVLGDANFGVFSVAWAATQTGHPVLLRLTKSRAQHLAGEPLRDGIDRELEWKASRADRRTNPDLPLRAAVRGRLLVQRVEPSNGAQPFLLALFTSLPDPAQQVVQFYGRRWNIETDLRTLKTTLALDQLNCTSAEMVAKEIEMGMAAYNLVRAATWLASQQSGIPPRGYSFTTVARILQTFGPALAVTDDPQQKQRIADQILYYVQQAQLPRRKRRRSYPRQVWRRGDTFPSRHS